MSKGSEKLTVRLPKGMRALMEQALARRNRKRDNDREWTLTDWVLKAIAAELSHCERGRGEKVKYEVDRPDENLPALFEKINCQGHDF